MYRRQERKSPFRYVVLFVLSIIFLAISFLIYDIMISAGFPNWWQYTIPIGVVWLIYLGIAYVLIGRE